MTVNYEQLARSFEACEVDASSFGHVDHVGVAYEMLCCYDFLDASVRYAKSIRTIANNAGAAKKFNLTITLGFLSLIAERIETTPHSGYEEFASRNPDLFETNAITKLYSADRLQSDLAREVFLMPDSAVA